MNESNSAVRRRELSRTRMKIENMEKKSSEAKKEIANLTGELEKLIQNNILKNDLEETKIPENLSPKQQITKKCVLKCDSVKNALTPRVQPSKGTPKKQVEKVAEVKVEKVKHYDPKLAREYMKKQKTLRQNKLQEEIRHKIIMQEEKRRKLKELQDKTLKILYNRNRQKSHRDKPPSGAKLTVKNNVEIQKKNSPTKSDLYASSSKISLSDSKDLKNKNELQSVLCKHSINSLEKRNLAAIKIQATYRGFKQRLKYKKLIEDTRNIRKIEETRKWPSMEHMVENKSSTNTPSWLQPAPLLPYPYNFITAVKQKLSLALYGYKYGHPPQMDHSLDASDINISNISQRLNDSINNTIDSTVHNVIPSKLKQHVDSSERINENKAISCSPLEKDERINHLKCSNSNEFDQIGIKSIRDTVSELKLNLNHLSSPSIKTNLTNKQSEKISTNTSEYVVSIMDEFQQTENVKKNKTSKLSEVSKEQGIIINSELSQQNNVVSDYSTGNDIESAILSSSESKSLPYSSSILKDKQKSNSSKNSDDQRKSNDVVIDQKLNRQHDKLSSYENTFTSYENVDDENNEEFSKSSSSRHLTAAQKLIPPSDKLKISKTLSQNVTNVKTNTEHKPQQINLNFEAEIKLLQTFQESLKQITTDNNKVSPVFHNCANHKQDVDQFTQTSSQKQNQTHVELKSSNSSIRAQHPKNVQPITYNDTNKITSNHVTTKNQLSDINNKESSDYTHMEKSIKNYQKFEEKLPFVNYKRGHGGETSKRRFIEKKNKDILLKSLLINNTTIDSTISNDESSTVENITLKTNNTIDTDKNINSLSLEMIEQQIKNEDIQLEHFKTLLKIREKALVDRTKGELVWLEITKRHLKERGDLNQVSTIKKKQRALILKLQHEKHEMQRLRSVHKASCEERKIILQEHKNIIKKQLSTKDMLTQFKRRRIHSSKEFKRPPGPIKVYELNNKSSSNQLFTLYEDKSSQQSSVSISEQVNIRTHRSSNCTPSDVDTVDYKKSITLHQKTTNEPTVITPTNLKLALLKREKDLKCRREKLEELLKWHQRLNDDEKQIAALEEDVRKLQFHNSADGDVTYSFSGSYLNNLWFIITGSKQDRYEQNKRYILSKIDMENFYENAKIEVIRKIEQLKTATPITAIPPDIKNVLSTEKFLKSVPVDNERLIEDSKRFQLNIEKDTSIEKIDKHSHVENSDQVLENFEVVVENLGGFEKNIDLEIEKDAVIDSESTLKIDGESISLKSEIKSDYYENNIISESEKISLEQLSDNITDANTNKHSDNENKIESQLSILENTITNIVMDVQQVSEKSENIEISLENQQPSREELNFSTNIKQIVNLTENSSNNSNIITEDNKKIENSENTSKLPSIDVSSINEQLTGTSQSISEELLQNNCEVITNLTVNSGTSLQQIVNASQIKSLSNSDEITSNVISISNQNHLSDDNLMNIDITEIENIDINEDFVAELELQSLNETLKSLENIDELLASISQDDFENNISSKLLDSDINIGSKNSENLTEINQQDISEKIVSTGVSSSSIVASEHKSAPTEIENSSEEIKEINSSEDHRSESNESSAVEKCTIEDLGNFEAANQTENVEEVATDISVNTNSSIETCQNSKSSNASPNDNSIINQISSDESISKSFKYNIEDITDDSTSDFKLISATDLSLQFDVKDNKNESSDNSEQIIENLQSASDSLSNNQSNSNSTSVEQISKNEQISNHRTTVKNKRKLAHVNKLNKDRLFSNETRNGTTEIDNTKLNTNCKNTIIPENLLLDSLNLYTTKITTNKLIVNEAEELRRKQLQIEQEIKELEKQQQSEILPYVYVREIPNKPPPPYQPPKASATKLKKYVIPTTLEQSMHLITKATDLLYNAYINNSINTIVQTPHEHFENNENEIENNYNRFFFDLCKEITQQYFMSTQNENEPSWMQSVSNTNKTHQQKIKNKTDLQKIVELKINECLNFSPVAQKKENLIICWSRNKRDHVDELLIKESQTEEAEWKNFEYDEMTIKNELTVDILDILINDTIKNICKTVKKKMNKV